jgi:hypothetical protein
MSSPSPSSTQKTDMSSSDISSQTDSNTPPFHSYKDLSGDEILIKTKQLQSEGIHYAAKENLVSQGEFVFNKNIRGDVFVPKDKNNNLSEYILTGIFQVEPRDFFFTSDGKWNANNPLGTRFDQVKPSCHLVPIERDEEFSFSKEDYPTIIANIRQIENLANPRKTRDVYSTIVEDHERRIAIKLTHQLFIVHFPILTFLFLIVFTKDKKMNEECLSNDNTNG